MVEQAFTRLDKKAEGFVDAAGVAEAFDACRHPDVATGKQSANEVLREFMDTFDVGGERDGYVSRAEFRGYYRLVSLATFEDEVFDLAVRNAWHLELRHPSTGTTIGRRPLLWHDGSGEVLEGEEDEHPVVKTRRRPNPTYITTLYIE